MLRLRHVTCVILTLAAACATGGATASDDGMTPSPAAARSRNSEIITAAELEDPALGDIDALAAVQRLRPSFLRNRGPVSGQNTAAGLTQISLDGAGLQSIGALRNVRANEVAEMRYFSASDAAQRFGTNAASGAVILVKRKSGARAGTPRRGCRGRRAQRCAAAVSTSVVAEDP